MTPNPIARIGSSVTLVRVELWDLSAAGANPQKTQGPERDTAPGPVWQREKDSNPHKQSQSLSCYLYTIPLNAWVIILLITHFVKTFFLFSV